jgi:hypothetical protein
VSSSRPASSAGVGFLLGAPATFVVALAGPALAEITSPRTTAHAACAVMALAAVYAASTPVVHQPFSR